jgi:gliding motility-associated-like protein
MTALIKVLGISILLLFTFKPSWAQDTSCLVGSLTISTSYNPTTASVLTAGGRDPKWQVTYLSSACEPPVAPSYVPPSYEAYICASSGGGGWASDTSSNWISFLSGGAYTTDPTGGPYIMTVTRWFKTCLEDSLYFDLQIADDNYITSLTIDGGPSHFSQDSGCYGVYYDVFAHVTFGISGVSPGLHRLDITIENCAVSGSNPHGLNLYGTVSSGTGIKSIVGETDSTCYSRTCADLTPPVCNTITLPDSLSICSGDTTTIISAISGPDSVISINWSPASGLSTDTGTLTPLLTASSSGYYYVTVKSLTADNLVYNGNFSLGDTGFSTGYAALPLYSCSPGHYDVGTDPGLYCWAAIGDHTSGAGNMLIVDASTSSGVSFWCQSIAVLPHTSYVFSFWEALLDAPVPIIDVSVNGVSIDTITTSTSSDTWVQYKFVWNNTSDTVANICLTDRDTTADGNDFAIDDISLVPICTATDSIFVQARYCGCDTLSMPDSVSVCLADTVRLTGVVGGSDSVVSIKWSPVYGLSTDTGSLDPLLTASSSGYYYLTIKSLSTDNIVVNGDFSAGDSAFSTAYSYTTGTSAPGDIEIGTNPHSFYSGWASFGDHTTGTGKMLIVDGSTVSGRDCWCESLPVLPHTNYDFGFWIALLEAPSPVVQLSVNGAIIDTVTTTTTTDVWRHYFSIWNSGTDTTAKICFRDLNTSFGGNDFALDDLTFIRLCSATDSVYVTVNNCSCDSVALPDTITVCAFDTTTLHASVFGADSVISILWKPDSGLSTDTGTLTPLLRVRDTSRYYYVTVESEAPGNLIVNGNFSAGNTGFTSAYSYVTGSGSLFPESVYTITTDPHLEHSGAASFGDHTTGHGKMMAINGASTPIDVWCETISVAPNTNYTFSAWFANWSSDTSDNLPIIKFEVNGTPITSSFAFPHAVGKWRQFKTTWNSGIDSVVTICINDSQTASYGNDFAIDDISLAPVCVSKDSIYVLVTPPPTVELGPDTAICLGTSLSLKSLTSYTGATYLWSDSSTASSFIVSTGGTYWETVTKGGCTAADSITIAIKSAPPFNLGNDTAICNGDSLQLRAPTAWAKSFLWSNGKTDSMIYVHSAGVYTASVLDTNGCSSSDSLALAINPIPVASLGDDTSVCAPTTLTLSSSDTYTSPTYLWNTGSKGSSISVSTSGSYWETVTVSGCTGSDTVTVRFKSPPTVLLRSDTALCSGDSLRVSVPQVGGVTYAWSTGATDTSIVISNAGTYYVAAADTNGCSALDSIAIAIIPLPVVALGNDTSVCAGVPLILGSADSYTAPTYLWNTGATTATITTSIAGIYWLQVTVNGCSHSDSILIADIPVPFVDLGPDTGICNHAPVVLHNFAVDSGASYLWSTGAFTTTTTVDSAGVYWLTVSSSGCSASDTIQVFAILDSVALFNRDTAICLGAAVQVSDTAFYSDAIFSYIWTPTAGISDPTIFAPLIKPDTSAMYYLSIKSPGCPTIRDSFFIDVQPDPTVYIGGNRFMCEFDSIHINAGVNPPWYKYYSYSWSPASAVDYPTAPVVVYTLDTSTKLYLTVTTPAGCMAEDSTLVTVYRGNFSNAYPANIFICPGDSTQLVDTGGVHYLWSPGTYLSNPTASNPWAFPITSTSYEVVASDIHGCHDTSTVNVTVYPAAVFTMLDSATIYPGESYQITPQTNCLTFSWFPTLGLSNSQISNPIAQPPVSTKYIVRAYTESGCSTVDSIYIYVDPETLLAIPNAFSPGNGPNHTFKLIKRGIATLNYFRIYNRWGNLVFETTNIDKGWDGTYNGKPQPEDVYVYVVDATTVDGYNFHKQGNLTLVK